MTHTTSGSACLTCRRIGIALARHSTFSRRIGSSLRPYSDEVTLEGAAAFASDRWLLAHALAMVGFILVALATAALWAAVSRTPGERAGYWATVVTAVGVGLTLPFYGAEVFGLHAIGAAALRDGSTTILAISSQVRGGFGLVVFLVGMLAVGTILTAFAVWRSGTLSHWSGVPFAIGFALFIPRFFGTPPIRVAHGALVVVGCALLAYERWRPTATSAARAT